MAAQVSSQLGNTALCPHFLRSSGVRSCDTVVSSMKKHLPLKVDIAVGAFVQHTVSLCSDTNEISSSVTEQRNFFVL